MDTSTSEKPVTRTDFIHRIATKKVMIKLVPLMMAAYLISYIDRTNVGLAKAALEVDAGISAAAFGLGAGIFFISYALLEIPSNLILHKIGARRWIARIAVTWGLLSTAMMFVNNEMTFYILRFLLGAAEAGLYPGLMYVITIWFAQEHRAKVVGLLLVASSGAAILGNPLGGSMMLLDGVLGLHGWQWLFVLEGLPAVAVGILIFVKFPDRPADAKWLTAEEAAVLTERAGTEPAGHAKLPLRKAFSDRVVLVVALSYFLVQLGTWGLIYFLPSVVMQLGVSGAFNIGLVAGLGSIGALVGVLVLPRMLRRTGHSEIPLIAVCWLGVIGTATAFMVLDQPALRMVAINAVGFFIIGMQPLIWSVAMARVTGKAAAAALAFVNTIGLLGGFFGPTIFGIIESQTGSAANGFLVVIATAVLGLAVVGVLRSVVRSQNTNGASGQTTTTA